jgi:hypothetical protein
MKVSIENAPDIPIANNGVKIRIRDEQGRNVGKLWFGQATIRWAPGRVPERNARRLDVQEFIDYLNQLPAPN